jgi:hypothetical protein
MSIRMRAEIKAGELLAEMKERGERQKPGEASGGNSSTRLPLTTPTLSDLGVTKTQSSRWRKAALSKEVRHPLRGRADAVRSVWSNDGDGVRSMPARSRRGRGRCRTRRDAQAVTAYA